MWPKATPEVQSRYAYTCRSYRCPSPECQRAAAHRDFAKISSAIATVDPRAGAYVAPDGSRRSGWVFVVLTLARETSQGSARRWRDAQEAFRELSAMSRNFLARLRRDQERAGERSTGSRWVGTVEVHRDGWPHYNLLLWAPELAERLDRERAALVAAGKPAEVADRLRGALRAHAVAVGWGAVGYAAPAAGAPEALAGYLVKLGASMERQVGELSKLTQAPVSARMKLRRIRAGRGFIPTAVRSERYTGIMLRRRAWRRTVEWSILGHAVRSAGAVDVEPLMQPDQVRCPEHERPAYVRGVQVAIAAELRQAVRELRGEPERLRIEPLRLSRADRAILRLLDLPDAREAG